MMTEATRAEERPRRWEGGDINLLYVSLGGMRD